MNDTSATPYLKSLAVVGIVTGFIFGPMLVIGGLGYWLGQQFDTIIFPIVFLLIALVVSNILIFKRTQTITEKLGSVKPTNADQE